MELVSGPLDLSAFGGKKVPYKILDTYIKHYPVEYHAQSAVEAALVVREELLNKEGRSALSGIAVVESATGPLYTAVFRPAPNGAEWVLGNYLWKDFAKQTDTYFAQGLYATGIAACRLAV